MTMIPASAAAPLAAPLPHVPDPSAAIFPAARLLLPHLEHGRRIDAPILRETHAILFEGKSPALALNTLMTRGLKRE